MPSGRIFLRRLIDLSTTVKMLSHRISINKEAREDLRWWAEFLPTWNGRYKILEPTPTFSHTLKIFTDVSGRLGFGIYFDGHWLSQAWPQAIADNSIQWKELYPIYLTCLVWKKSFQGKRLLFHCDNQAMVDIWSSQTWKSPEPMALLHKLFFVSAQFEYTVNVRHIPGLDNSIADCLSRLQIEKFFHLALEGRQGPDSHTSGGMAVLAQDLGFLQFMSISGASRRTSSLQFCNQFRLIPFPASETSLNLSITYLARNLSFATIRTYLAAVRYWNIREGFSVDFGGMVKLHMTLKGIKRLKGAASRPNRLPITIDILKNLRAPLAYVSHP